MDIAIVRADSIFYHSRMRKVAESLCKKYSVLVLGWNREGVEQRDESILNRHLILFNLRAPYGSKSIVLYFPIYWFWVLVQLIKHRPAIVHASDLDSALPSCFYKIIFKRQLVFDVSDRYSMAYIPQKFKTLYSLVSLLEERVAEKADALINVSDILLQTFKRRSKLCTTIMNCAEDQRIERNRSENNGKFTIVHAGGVRKWRGLEETIAAIKDLDEVKLVIAGRVIDLQLV